MEKARNRDVLCCVLLCQSLHPFPALHPQVAGPRSQSKRKLDVKPSHIIHALQVSILILGAGPTGLGAATRLHQHGHTDWLLLEQVSVERARAQ